MTDALLQLQSRSLYLRSLEQQDTNDLVHLFRITENLRLFTEEYKKPFIVPGDLTAALESHSQNPSAIGKAYAVVPHIGGPAIGWIVVRYLESTLQAPFCAVFVSDEHRHDRIAEVFFMMCEYALEQLRHDNIQFRTGGWHQDPTRKSAGDYGMSMTGVLKRQMLIRKGSQVLDLYEVTKTQWPSIKESTEAWWAASVMDANPASEVKKEQGP
ncbi:hypothetical protein BAUCODRAFT_488180 [Baudoinia panamericana UAMH 10762]|uniref:N-acetyltransferase domain-containing protein n=1 Tax=Baudoinia panamericana (strain UAMH 10762) TaxID=717646 RepID=M2LQN4_BAUPA|nr:uncharacterized protein BAUCODRAFT_488180 [Baudoinia panamericana UAMH 10762]EMC96742.1 hypothetical protein BAUCODRAFT_488180 [Baudoinia panamericana UAMH 10762]